MAEMAQIGSGIRRPIVPVHPLKSAECCTKRSEAAIPVV